MKKPLPSKKKAFFDLLNRAVRTTEKANRGKQKSQRTSDCSSKRTRQHKTGGALKKRSDKSRQ